MEKLKKFNRIFVLLLSFTFLISPMNVNAKKKNQEKKKHQHLKLQLFQGLNGEALALPLLQEELQTL